MAELLPGLSALKLPPFWRAKQNFPDVHITKIGAELQREFARPDITATLDSVKKARKPPVAALAVGSRGIANLPGIVRETVGLLRAIGWEVFIVPAMGSHGGAAAEGQINVLKSLGVTEISTGAAILSSMDVVEIGRTGKQNEIPLYMDALAYAQADAVIPIARVKPHTSFRGPIESGLCKMISIGLSKHTGCARLHREGFVRFAELIPAATRVILSNNNIPFGIAILENAHEQIFRIEAVPAASIVSREPALLAEARSMMPRILLPEIDVLVVDEIGKDISGTGMDPNITGRSSAGPVEGFHGPKISRVVVLGLSDATQGNATGLGTADLTTQRLVSQIDYTKTYANVLTSGNLGGGKIPVALPDDSSAILAATQCVPGIVGEKARIVRIKNTLQLTELAVSENLKSVVEALPGCEVSGPFDGTWTH